jgi:hypothetical protein
MPMTEVSKQRREIRPETALCIKLGEHGKWERDCIQKTQTLRLGYEEVPHDLCLNCDWSKVQDSSQRAYSRKSGGAAKRDAGQIKHFYEAGEEVLWVTFFGRRLWWCFSKPQITRLSDGTKTRPVIGAWSDKDLRGKVLDFSSLSGKLLALQAFRGTICKVEHLEYLQHKINGTVTPEARAAQEVRAGFQTTLESLIKQLHPKDFEILVDLLFRQAGFRRISVLGETEKKIDLDLVAPITEHRYAVQVKSKAGSAEMLSFASSLHDMPQYGKGYFVVHSPSNDLTQLGADERVDLLLPSRLADWAIRYGLADWVVDKVG